MVDRRDELKTPEINEEASNVIKEIRFGNKVDLSLFENQEQADEFTDNFMQQYPRADDELLANKEKELGEYQSQEDKNNTLGTINHIFDDFHNRVIPQSLSIDGVYKFKELDSMSENYADYDPTKSCAHKFEKMPKNVADVVYPNMQKCMIHRLTSNNPSNKKKYPKTPYQEVPLQKRLLNKLYKATKNPKFDSNIEMLKNMDITFKNYHDTLAGGDVFSDSTILKKFDGNPSTSAGMMKDNMTSNKAGIGNRVNIAAQEKSYSCGADYLMELATMPYEEMLKKVDKDYDKFELKGNELAAKIKPLKEGVDMMHSQNNTHDSIKKTLDTKFKAHFALQKNKHRARTNLAKNGMMSNEEIKQKNPKHGSVKVDEAILRRKNEGR